MQTECSATSFGFQAIDQAVLTNWWNLWMMVLP